MKSILPFLLAIALPFSILAQQTTGLFQYDWPTDEGFILWSPLLNGHSTYLMNNCGEVVHTWNTPDFTPANSLYLQPDGSLMIPAKADTAQNNPINGGGAGERITRLDWDGNVLWDYIYYDATKRLHHDIEILPNGNVLAIAWVLVDSADCVAAGRDSMMLSSGVLWSERIIEVEPTGATTGNIVWQWDLWDHLVQDFDVSKDNYGVVSEHPELLDINWVNGFINDSTRNDFVHLNSIDYNEELDQIVLSSQVHSEIWIIDHSTTTQEAASHSGGTFGKGGDFLYRYGNPQVYDRGNSMDQILWRQHDANWIADGLADAGGIMIYNNGQNRAPSYSEIDVVTPPQSSPGVYNLAFGEAYGPATKTWTYHAADSVSFYSFFISGARRLPNGNTLVCEGQKGRMFEITHEGDKVWEYVSPVEQWSTLSSTDVIPLAGGGSFQGNVVFRAVKYSQDYPGFTGHDLSSGVQLEANPFLSSCLVSVKDFEEEDYQIYPNPTEGEITIDGLSGASMRLFDISGRQVFKKNIVFDTERLNLDGFLAGLYMLEFTQEGKRMSSKLMIN